MTVSLSFYRHITGLAEPLLTGLLKRRIAKGKEDPARWTEKKGEITYQKPEGPLVWLHAASVGEAQSALILLKKILEHNAQLNTLVTSGTVTSAELLEKSLPERAFHQFAPLDHPKWVKRFLDYWQPTLSLRMESELWPNTLCELHQRHIPTLLINARLSEKSFKNWCRFPDSAKTLLSELELILCQTEHDAEYFRDLGAKGAVKVTGNLKYSADPLPFHPEDLETLKQKLRERPLWLYASTHDGEEDLAARLHQRLKNDHPDLLTIIVPRHPERGPDIEQQLSALSLKIVRRTKELILPETDTDLYICDTLGELGLFYRLCPIACIGRSFSHDGGGGHNPLEAAQLDCAVLYGPHVQYQQALFDDMSEHKAAQQVQTEEEFYNALKLYLSDDNALSTSQERAKGYAQSQTDIIDTVFADVQPFLQKIEEQTT